MGAGCRSLLVLRPNGAWSGKLGAAERRGHGGGVYEKLRKADLESSTL